MKVLAAIVVVLSASAILAGSPTALFGAVFGVVAAESTEFETEEVFERELEAVLSGHYNLLGSPECDVRLPRNDELSGEFQISALDCLVATAEYGAVIVEAQKRGARTVLAITDRSEGRLVELFDPPSGLDWLPLASPVVTPSTDTAS